MIPDDRTIIQAMWVVHDALGANLTLQLGFGLFNARLSVSQERIIFATYARAMMARRLMTNKQQPISWRVESDWCCKQDAIAMFASTGYDLLGRDNYTKTQGKVFDKTSAESEACAQILVMAEACDIMKQVGMVYV